MKTTGTLKTRWLSKRIVGLVLAVTLIFTQCVIPMTIFAEPENAVSIAAESYNRIFFEEVSKYTDGFGVANAYDPTKLFTTESLISGHKAMSALNFRMTDDIDLEFTTDIYVETAGTYLIKTVGSITSTDSKKHNWLTGCTVKVDGEKLGSNPIFSEEFVTAVPNNYHSTFAGYTSVLTSQLIELSEGYHTITHAMGGRGGTRDMYAFALDFMDITKTCVVDGEHTTVIPAYYLNPSESVGAMVIPGNTMTTNLNNDGKIEENLIAVHVYNVGKTDYSVNIEVARDDIYDISFLVSPCAANWQSAATIRIDGEESYAQSHKEEILNYNWTGEEKQYGYKHSDFQPNRYTKQVYLDAGIHTIEICFENMADGYPIFTFDRIEIAQSDNGLNMEKSLRIEAENTACEWEMVSDANVSGGKLVWLSTTEAKPITFTFPVVEDGYYNLNLCASNSVTNEYLSIMNYQIDDEDVAVIEKTSPVLSVPQEQQATDSRLGVFEMSLFRCGDAHYLTKGLHTITVTLTLCPTNPDGYFATVDYIELRPKLNYDGIYLDVDNGYTVIGETAQVRVLNSDGNEVMQEDTFKEIKYVLSDESEEDIAELDGDCLMGVNFGKGIVEAVFEIENESYDLKTDFYVTDSDGLVLNSASVAENQLKVNIRAMKAGNPSAKLFAYVYEQSEGMVGSIKDVYQLQLPRFEKDDVKELIQTIDVENNDVIGVILMNADDRFAAYRQLVIR